MEKMLTPVEVAEMLQIDEDTVRRLANKKQIEHSRIGVQYRFTPHAIDTYVKSRTIPAKNNKFLKTL